MSPLSWWWGCAEPPAEPVPREPPPVEAPPVEVPPVEQDTATPPPEPSATGRWQGQCDFGPAGYGILPLQLKLLDEEGVITGTGRLEIDVVIAYTIEGQRTDDDVSLQLYSLYSVLLDLGAELQQDTLVGEITIYPSYLGGPILSLPCVLDR